MKLIFSLYLVIVLPHMAYAQDKFVKYYDNDWAVTESEKSTYTAEFVAHGERYNCIFYWTSTKALAGKATYTDTTLNKPVGLVLGYYKNGRTEDSVFYDDNSRLINRYHYYQNGQLESHYYIPAGQNKPIIEAYDETGKRVKNYIYEKEAEFKGGEKAWNDYLLKNVNTKINAPGNGDVTVTVKVLFVVNEFGNTAKAKVIESSGVPAVDRDAVRVILGSPVWNNAISLNKPVKVYRIQPLTYQLTAAKKLKD